MGGGLLVVVLWVVGFWWVTEVCGWKVLWWLWYGWWVMGGFLVVGGGKWLFLLLLRIERETERMRKKERKREKKK